jgi:predicted DNA-binding protein with PD1-like motif
VIIAESRRGRRIVGRLDRGVELFPTLEAICRERGVRTAELRALGSLETVEVAEYDQAAKVWKPGRKFAAGGFEILNLTGNVSERDGQVALHAHATLMRDRDNGVEMIGGHVIAARVFALEFVLECFDDVILRRGADPATGLTLWREAIEVPAQGSTPSPAVAVAVAAIDEDAEEDTPPPRFEPPPPRVNSHVQSAGWSEVAAASATKGPPATGSTPADDGADDSLEPGDVLVHPTFGRCEVQRIEGAYEFAHVRLRNGRLVRLSLDVLKLSGPSREDNKRVFRARVE